MGPITAQLLDELGYDPDDGVPEFRDLGEQFAGIALPAGAVIAARVGARRVAIARLGSGRLVVVDDECPHDGGRISDGFVEGERLICARHGWTLEARNGRCERACKLRE
ncbi:MAG TPA: Rieske 2Fe-2S domain-containing protein [Kofleriaceae bacterium]|jgi:nitrite reductase/ring-hydroxylating ferredoxin subunit|nr:Rieske 2Fe-2S domain-containing protein [Kofleriaceae bacterium]